jgi:hypothetical protein
MSPCSRAKGRPPQRRRCWHSGRSPPVGGRSVKDQASVVIAMIAGNEQIAEEPLAEPCRWVDVPHGVSLGRSSAAASRRRARFASVPGTGSLNARPAIPLPAGAPIDCNRSAERGLAVCPALLASTSIQSARTLSQSSSRRPIRAPPLVTRDRVWDRGLAGALQRQHLPCLVRCRDIGRQLAENGWPHRPSGAGCSRRARGRRVSRDPRSGLSRWPPSGRRQRADARVRSPVFSFGASEARQRGQRAAAVFTPSRPHTRQRCRTAAPRERSHVR